jgi:hypothetical protein
MKDYILRFEFYGKRMTTKVRAYSVEHAKSQVNDRLNFISIEDIDKEDDTLDFLKDIFNFK